MSGKTDTQGRVRVQFPSDTRSIHLRKIGYVEIDSVIQMPLASPLTWVMKTASIEGITVKAETGDLARRILKLAIDQRENHAQRKQAWSYRCYSKLSLNEAKPDTAVFNKDSLYLALTPHNRPTQLYQIELKEYANECYIGTNDHVRSVVFSAKEHTKDRPSSGDFNAGFSIDYGEHDVVPEQWLGENPYQIGRAHV